VELGDDEFATRQAASRKLRAAGEPAEAALEKAADSPDAEVKKRARAILADFRWGIYPSTPDAIVELVRKYQSSTLAEKRQVIVKLIAAGRPGAKALVRVARNETDVLVRRDVFSHIAANLGRELPSLLEDGHDATVESLLELGLSANLKTGAPAFAAYHLLRGSLPRKIAEWEALARRKVVPKAEQEVLAYLYRANGDLAKAVQAALAAERNDLREGFLYEKADWKELVRLAKPTSGFRLAYARLAGDRKVYEEERKSLFELGLVTAKHGAEPDARFFAKALFLNGEARQALEVLARSGKYHRLHHDVLAVRLQVKEAFALVEKLRKEKSPELPGVELAHARFLHLLGETDKALAIVKSYAGRLEPDKEGLWYENLLETDLALGRRDDAFTHAGKLLAGRLEPALARRLFEKLFPDHTDHALAVWTVLKKVNPGDKVSDRLAGLRRLMEGTAPAREVKSVVERTLAKVGSPTTVPGNPEVTAFQCLGLGEAALLCKQEALALECFTKSFVPGGLLRVGDIKALQKKWSEAATAYRSAYQWAMKTPALRLHVVRDETALGPALPLFLHGHALVQAGQTAQGQRRMEQARLLPLGDGESRLELARALLARGHREEARRHYDVLRRVGEPALSEVEWYYTGEGLRMAAIVASERKEWLHAADGFEQSFLRVLLPDLNFGRAVAYVTVPAHISRIRARGLAEAGRFAQALEEVRRAEASLPGHLDLAIGLMPLLTARGRKKDVDLVFRTAWAPYAALLREHPRCSWAHNQLAWLSACTRRDLEEGLRHAREAVALAPGRASYHDTLAEVLFQLGKKDDAVAAQKKAVSLDPKRAYLRKQLKRIEAGDATAPRPAEDE
jgi:tetratricopeptide (TPR) repeat protein